MKDYRQESEMNNNEQKMKGDNSYDSMSDHLVDR